MGIRPRGEGEREIVRQYEEADDSADKGDRWPFGVPFGVPFIVGRGFLGCGGDCAAFVTMDFGLRLRALARSSENCEGLALRLVIASPIGAK